MIKQKQSPRLRSHSNFEESNNQFITRAPSRIHPQKGTTQQLNKLSEQSFASKEQTSSNLPNRNEGPIANFGIKNFKNLGVKQKFKNKNRVQQSSIVPPKVSNSQPKSSSGQYVTPSSHKSFNHYFSARSQLEEKQNPSSSSLAQENKKLKGKVSLMVSQFQQIESRLNKQISKRKITNRKGGESRAHSLQHRSSQQILNAEQRCKIYQKQVETLKNRYSIFTEEKVNSLSEEVDKLRGALKSIENENKDLKRAVKEYESRIFSMGGTQNHKLVKQEMEGLKAQNKRLKAKIKKDEQEQRMQQLILNTERIKLKRESEAMQQQRRKAAVKNRQQQMQKELESRNYEIKELKDWKTKHEEEKYQLQNDTKDLKTKNYDNQFEIKKLLAENSKHRNEKDQFKRQLQQKEDELMALNQKVLSYEKEKQALMISTEDKQIQTQLIKQPQETLIFQKDQLELQKLNQAPLEEKQGEQKQEMNQEEASKEEKVSEKQEQKYNCEENQKQQILITNIQKDSDESPNAQQTKKQLQVENTPNVQLSGKNQLQRRDQPLSDIFQQESMKAMIKIQKYPIRLFLGESQDESFKWNHFQFASKIKEIQVMRHVNGHIKNLNFRYEKGEPSKLQKGEYSSFVCSQSQEFIKKIKFIFMNGILFSIWALSSFKREWSFGDVEGVPSQRLEALEVGVKQFEYPSCVFGENINEGIVRIGCLVEQSKNGTTNQN